MLESIGTILHGDPVNKDEINRVRDVILFEEPDLKKKLVKFFILLILAAGISTYGLLSNSVATIIGAMIVAPLMLPIMGLAFSISVGDGYALKNSLLISLGGIAVAIFVGYLLAYPINNIIMPQNIDQIMSRTSPGLLDLLAALVTGLAGAFAMSRSDVSDTLPGVAIAISLVPPLANTGILLATSDFNLAMGSFLLFITNFFAILLTGALLFAVMGFPRVSGLAQHGKTRRKGIAIVIVMILLISVPLAYNGANILIANTVTGNVQDASDVWLNGSNYQVASVNAQNQNHTVTLVVTGNGELPPLEKLDQLLAGKLYGKTLQVKVIPSTVYYLNIA
jgi:uncharacterized hydrophobic protein (TIGR00271 family)